MKDLMLDIETFGTGNNAAIVSIGAVFFDADADVLDADAFGPEFHMGVDVTKTDRDMLGTMDATTVAWWLSQDKPAQDALLAAIKGGEPLGSVLQSFANFVIESATGVERIPTNPRNIRLWSNGPTFDETIVRAAFDRYGIPLPISYRGSRCCRTMFDMARSLGWNPEELGRNEAKHDALADALFQARGVILQRQHLRARHFTPVTES